MYDKALFTAYCINNNQLSLNTVLVLSVIIGLKLEPYVWQWQWM